MYFVDALACQQIANKFNGIDVPICHHGLAHSILLCGFMAKGIQTVLLPGENIKLCLGPK